MRMICKTHSKYKGIRKPRCNKGDGCWACWNKYYINHKLIFLDEWSVTGDNDPYKAPELHIPHLHGFAYGHPKHEDGKQLTTSRVVDINGRVIKTRTGSVYVLGEPQKEYIDWLITRDLPLPTDRQPIMWKNENVFYNCRAYVCSQI